jgi:hypothetical protein
MPVTTPAAACRINLGKSKDPAEGESGANADKSAVRSLPIFSLFLVESRYRAQHRCQQKP